MSDKNIIPLPEVECLECRTKGGCVTNSEYIKTRDNLILRPIICLKCRRHWKDFYGVDDENSPVISIQRDSSSSVERSPSTPRKNKS